ncbi:MAG TPA: glycosyltransferase [Pyrinomonadaceae bacterium]|nr:glycosyltransferase [Pyrinomonadaceae bacterium]
MNNTQPIVEKRHLLTVMLEDYFHVTAFNGLIQRSQWDRFETRLENNTLRALDLLDKFNIKATFFVLGWIADKQPEIVREVARRGHEIGSRGLYHRSTRQMTPDEFRDDLARSRDAVERASGTRVIGYRAARRWSSTEDLWALDILAEEGYVYDSSLAPISRRFNHEPWRRFAHEHRVGDKRIWEFPASTWNLLGWRIPIAGGNYFRQFPHTLLKHAVEYWHKHYDAPFVMYTHVWELDPEQPRISSASPITKIRHYRNLDKMSWVLEDYFSKYRFVGVANYLGLSHTREDESGAEQSELARDAQNRLDRRRPVLHLSSTSAISAEADAPEVRCTPVSIVVPCFNEEIILPYLSNTLKSVVDALQNDYDLRFIFVDDGSRDKTFESLQRLFGSWPNCDFVRHQRNLGVAAAILDGIRHAQTEIVCSIDCDCTYDPHELRNMIPLLAENVSLVTASPYHPRGYVRNVPHWRLSLSKGASFLYRHVLRQKLHTYTSCFRVYRRDAVIDMRLSERGFLGVTEILGRLDLRGEKVVEYPALLEVRLFGRSKMKVLKTIAGHLRLLTRLLTMRVHSGITSHQASAEIAPVADVSLNVNYKRPAINSQK